MKWRVIRAIAQKDIVDAVKNTYLLFGLILPIGLSLLLRIVFPASAEELKLTVAVYDPERSSMIAEMRSTPGIQLLEASQPEEVPDLVKKRAVGGLALPAGFDAAVKAGQRPVLTVYTNQRRGGGELAAYQRLVERLVWGQVGQELPVRIDPIQLGSAPGLQGMGEFRMDRYMLIMFLVMSLAMTGSLVVPTLLVEEKEKHTLNALLVSPASSAEVAAGKALTGLFYSLLLAAVMLGLNRGWGGNWPLTMLIVVLGSLFMVAVGLVMGAVFQNAAQVNTWSTLVLLALMMPSWLTVVQMPKAVEVVFRLMPTDYMVQALGLTLAGQASLAKLWFDVAVMAGSGAAALVAVVWMLRRELH